MNIFSFYRSPVLSKKPLIALVSLLLISFSVVACAKNSSADSHAYQVESGVFPVTIEHKYGKTTITRSPKRIVAIGWNDGDIALSLGVVPVAIRKWVDNYHDLAWVKKESGNLAFADLDWPNSTESSTIDIEAVATYHPDLILALDASVSEADYKKLSQLAPTVVQTARYDDEKTPWNIATQTIGKALGKPHKAEEVINEVQKKIDEAKQQHPIFAGKTVIADFFPDTQHYLPGMGDSRRIIFDALGFRGPKTDQYGNGTEDLSVLDKDVLFINGGNLTSLMKNIAFSQLNVVKQKRVIYVKDNSVLSSALSLGGANGISYALPILVPVLADVLAGKPAPDISNS